jgi:hypothetical protein
MLWINQLSTENVRFWFRPAFSDGVLGFRAILFNQSAPILIDHV